MISKRPLLTTKITMEDFLNYYWLKEELRAFCTKYKLPTSGSKEELQKQIEHFLKTGTKLPKKISTQKSKVKDSDNNITLKTLVKNFRNDAKTRKFFAQQIGKNFHFNEYLREFAKKNLENNTELTYGNLVKGWIESEELKKQKNYKSKIGSQFEYMTFIRDFFAFEKNKSKKEAIAAWNSIKLLPGKKTYENYLKNIKSQEIDNYKKNNLTPDPTAVRVALWRALHVLKDLPPHIFKDEIALKVIDPEIDWQSRADMHLDNTKGFRASIVARSRFIEDIVLEKIKFGIKQYLIFGAGIDTFVQRHPELENKVSIFEIDKKETQKWKISRFKALGYNKPKNLNYISVDLSGKISWYEKLIKSKFDLKSPSITAIAGVSLYLSKKANLQLLAQFAKFPKGSIVILSFILPIELLEEKEKNNFKQVILRAKQAGTPFLSFFSPHELLIYAKNAGFKKVTHVGKKEIINLYFKDRKDDFLPSSGEEYIIACT